MYKWRCGSASFLLILAIGSSIAETVQNDNDQVYTTLPESARQVPEQKAISGELDYESALRPAVLQKRSIANIARLLLGGSVPPNHPLVKYPDPKSFNLANNIMASLQPGSSVLTAAASTTSEGWSPRQPGGSSALQNIQQLFETKSKIIPYTGQVATGLTGLASVKGDLLRQIHSISTQAIAQAAAEAAARALASAAAAHAVTNSISNSINNPGAQTGIKGGWSSFQNIYAEPQGKTPGEQAGPPYSDSSAHINHYQPPPSYYSTPSQTTPSPMPPTQPPPPPPTPYQAPVQPQQQHYQQYKNNGYYTINNYQQSRPPPPHHQNPFTQAYAPAHHARPTLSPSTLIATTPSSVPFGFFGRNAPQPSSTSSLLSSISSLLSASTAAYNAAVASDTSNSNYRGHQQQHHSNSHQQQSPTVFPNLLSSSASSYPTTIPSSSPEPRPTAPVAAAPSSYPPPSLLSSGIGSSSIYNNGYRQQPINPVSQTGSHYGSNPSGNSPGYFQHPISSSSAYPSTNHQAHSAPVNPSSYSFNQHGSPNSGANYAQSGANPYNSQSVQSSPQFGNGLERSSTVSNGNSGGYSTTNTGFHGGSGYNGYNGGTGSGAGHVSGWNTQHAGSSPSASTWPAGSGRPGNGYADQTPGNFNNSPGSYGTGGGQASAPTQYSPTPGSRPSTSQQTYPTAYQSSASNFYAQTQQTNAQNPTNQYRNTQNYNSFGGIRNPNLNQNQNQRYDQTQSASTMGNDYDNDNNNDNYNDDDEHDRDHTPPRHHSYQQRRRNRPPPPSQKNSYNGSKYPSPAKKRPFKRPNNYPPNFNKNMRNDQDRHHHEQQDRHHEQQDRHHQKHQDHHHQQHQDRQHHQQKQDHQQQQHHDPRPRHRPQQHNSNKNNIRKDAGGPPENNGKRVIPTGPKKGSHFDSPVDVDVVDASSSSLENDYFVEGLHSDNNKHDNNHKTRWRPKSSTGQRPNSFHNHHSNERWAGKEAESYKTPPKNVRVKGPGRPRTQSEKQTGPGGQYGNLRSKKVPLKGPEKWGDKKSKTEAAELYRNRGRVRGPGQQQGGHYKSRDVYTTLPEFVFKMGERPDVFLRPGRLPGGDRGSGEGGGGTKPRNKKQRVPVRGRGRGGGGALPRLGETNGRSDGDAAQEKNFKISEDHHPYKEDEAISRESSPETDLDKQSHSERRGAFSSDADAVRGEEEEFIRVSEAIDETARADVIDDQIMSDSGFLTSEEFDPEEREAFVNDVYADEQESHYHYPQQRQDYDESIDEFEEKK